MARSAEQTPCRSIPTPRRSRRSLIRVCCASTYQSQRRSRRSSKRSRSKKAKANEDLSKHCCGHATAALHQVANPKLWHGRTTYPEVLETARDASKAPSKDALVYD